MSEESIFNGINGSTGAYLQASLTDEEIAEIALGEEMPKHHLNDLKKRYEDETRPDLGLRFGLDEGKLSESGWGVIFPPNVDQEIVKALRPLLDLRRDKASEIEARRYQEYMGDAGYQRGETKLDFLTRQPHILGPGDVNPDQVPYYLLIVGSPEEIPFTFQYELDVQFSVGRLHFDTTEEYANYARTVVAAETSTAEEYEKYVGPEAAARADRPAVARQRQAAFFGTSNDKSTRRSAKDLVEPLYNYFKSGAGWQTSLDLGQEATKERLKALFCEADKPAFLFTATHGVGFDADDFPTQRERQGALLCQNPNGSGIGKASPDDYLSAADIGETASPAGLISFHFACYGAGTPRLGYFSYIEDGQERNLVAEKPFVARLAQRLLGHPKGGALAFVSHVDQAWSTSFRWANRPDINAFETMLDKLRAGYPIGYAVESINDSYAHLATDLKALKEHYAFGADNAGRLAYVWKAANDARSYIILGDPAVRLVLAG